jgi:tRNA pseudouridine38-40 synthase
LPPAIRVLSAEQADPDFHPRFNAIAKTYEYRIVRTPICSPFEWHWVLHHPYPLDEEAMMRAAGRLEGEHDFTAYAASDDHDAEGKSKVRTIFDSRLERVGDRLVYRVRGSGFLKHMVRNIVGTLIEVGRGNLAVEALPQVEKCGATVPAKGLTLISVEYPHQANESWMTYTDSR